MKLLKALLVLATFLLLLAGATRAETLTMHVIDVGQAESLLLEMPHHAVLVDAGGEDTFDQNRYLNALTGYLDRFFARRTDLGNKLYGLVVSHPHIDHTRYLKNILERYTVENFIEGGNLNGSGQDDLVAARRIVNRKGIKWIRIKYDTVNSAEVRAWASRIESGSGARVRFLSGRRGCQDENNDSLVMRVDYGQKSLLLTGDSEVDDQEFGGGGGEGCGGLLPYLLHRYRNEPAALKASVYKVGHHGSPNGTSDAFIRAVQPEMAVMSAGSYKTRSSNKFHSWFFGHPNETAVRLLEAGVSESREQPIEAFTLRRPKRLVAHRRIERAIYCTCWDASLRLTLGDDNTPIRFEGNVQ